MFFVSSANIIFSFDVQYAIVSVYDSLKDKSEKQLYKLNYLGIAVIGSIILIVSIAGFFTSPYDHYDLIIFRNPIGDSDYQMCFAKIIVCFAVITDVSINHSMVRSSFFSTFFNKANFNNKE